MTTHNLIICGATGRMGKLICQLAEQSAEWKITGKVDSKNPLEEVIDSGDVIIDFSLPQATSGHLLLAARHQIPIVIGTTGLEKKQHAEMVQVTQLIPIVYSANMSVGMNVLCKLIEVATKKLGGTFDIEISETHHIHKKDQPSGTSKMMGLVVEKVIGKKPPIESIREGEVIGEHTIVFGSPFEHIALLHSALDRRVFAEGALTAARWILGKSPGLYSMQDVLGLD
ncbi:MAG: dihydrodipicolinate reductase C-terminal domain-containing protein [Deltaproteobacteria bacterium]|nr:dihydrodipicolinate reductase C-terminal domain-containing protein [Deltaproteobacteria bacterium]